MKTISSTSPWVWRGACVLVLLGYLLTVPHTWQCEGVDEIEYLGLAHSLETGQGYTLYGEPYGYYPPLYPGLLAQIMHWDVTAWRLMYLANALFGFLALVYLCSWLRQSYGRAGHWAAWFGLLAYYPWSFSTRYLLAEPLFFLLSVLALVEVDRIEKAGRCTLRSAAILAGCITLSAMTKASTVAVLATIGVTLCIYWLKTKRAFAAMLLALVMLCAGGFMVGWEIRSQLVAPQAQESYGRWILKWVGMSNEAQGIIAANRGEGTEGVSSIHERAAIAAVKIGQYDFSAVRPPRNFVPLGMTLAVITILGLVHELKRRTESPLAWYVLITLVIICLTSWVSSYHRYLYPLSPLLFLFLFKGAASLQRSQGVRWVAAVVGCVGIILTWRLGLFTDVVGSERVYVTAFGFVCLALYIYFLVSAIVNRGLLNLSRSIPDGALAWLTIIFLMHTLVLSASRFKLTLRNATLAERNMVGVVDCSLWVKRNTEAGAHGIASMPRLIAFLADRPIQKPSYDQDGKLLLHDANFVITSGLLQKTPAFREDAEQALKAQMFQASALPVFASHDAAVYKISP